MTVRCWPHCSGPSLPPSRPTLSMLRGARIPGEHTCCLILHPDWSELRVPEAHTACDPGLPVSGSHLDQPKGRWPHCSAHSRPSQIGQGTAATMSWGEGGAGEVAEPEASREPLPAYDPDRRQREPQAAGDLRGDIIPLPGSQDPGVSPPASR